MGMMGQKRLKQADTETEQVFDEGAENDVPAIGHNPLDGEELLVDVLYGPSRRNNSYRSLERPPPREPIRPKEKPTHYKVVSISLYLEDIERLEGLVKAMKMRGYHKANKSQVIRQALAQFDPDKAKPEPL